MSHPKFQRDGIEVRDRCGFCSKINFDDIRKYSQEKTNDGIVRIPISTKTPACRLCRFLLRVASVEGSFSTASRNLNQLTLQSLPDFVYAKCISHKPEDFSWIIAGESNLRGEEVLGLKRKIRYPKVSPCLVQVKEKVDWNLVRSWLECCTACHPKACQQSEIDIELRVINCSTRCTTWLPSSSTAYITLSYLWGETAGDDMLDTDFLPEQVPAVIDDAIFVAQLLGFKYIWVDRYCIDQDNQLERHQFIQNMNKIYAQSALTIIAATGNGPWEGLCGVSSKREPQDVIRLKNHVLLSSMFNKTVENIRSSKWNTRGWTFQEGLLSCKRLVFTKHQVYFQCQEMRCFESFAIPIHRLHMDDGRFHQDIMIPQVFPTQGAGTSPTELIHRINEFMKRDLWTNEDTISAFSGILQHFKKMKYRIESICGLPIYPAWGFEFATDTWDRIAWSLTWQILGEGAIVFSNRRHKFPSWTWADWKITSKTISFWMDCESKRQAGYIVHHGEWKNLVDISIKFSESRHYTSNKNKDFMIPELDDESSTPKLEINGICVPLTMTLSGGVWELKSMRLLDPGLSDVPWEFRARMQITRELYEDHEFLGVLVHRTAKNTPEYQVTYSLLLLEPQPNQTFARVGTSEVIFSGTEDNFKLTKRLVESKERRTLELS